MNALALAAERAEPSAGGTIVKRPRIGLLRPWGSSMDEGWTRWVMEQYGFDLVTLRPADFRSPLAAKVDVVIITEDGRLPVEGAGRPGQGSGAGKRRARGPRRSARVRGRRLGRGPRRIRAVHPRRRHARLPRRREHVRDSASSGFRSGTPSRASGPRTTSCADRSSRSTPDTTHPVMDGMPEKAAMVFVDSSPVFETLEGFKGRVLAKYHGRRIAAASRAI